MKTFSKNLALTSLATLFMAMALPACKKDKARDLSGNYSVVQGKNLELKPNSQTAVTISLAELADTRCPINALCATAGFGKATLKIKDLSIRKEKTVTLYIGYQLPQEQSDVTQVNINGVDYAVQLQDIFPYPGINVAHTTKTALIVLSKL